MVADQQSGEVFSPESPPEAQTQTPEIQVDFRPKFSRSGNPQPEAPLKLETRGITPHFKQGRFYLDLEALKNTVARKLEQADRPDLALPLKGCRTQMYRKLCTGCRSVSTYYNRCENFYCPCCQPRLSRDKRQSVEFWVEHFTQPKHVVLTARNSDTLTHERVAAFKAAFLKLRRTKFASNWEGGIWSLEVTNEGRGWHLHLHALVEARWIDQVELSKRWGKLVGQDYAIVKVMDVREKSYLRECTKYVVDGNQLAGWSAEDVVNYVTAFLGHRSFGVFGELYKQRALWTKALAEIQSDVEPCACGCTSFRFFDENEWDEWECRHGPVRVRAPQNSPAPKLDTGTLPLNLPVVSHFLAPR